MSLELWGVIASLTTTVVIAATAIAAIAQLRHMRMGNQIAALLSIQNELDMQDFRDAEHLLRTEIEAALTDSDFCAFLIAYSRPAERVTGNEQWNRLRRAAVLVGNTYENLGALLKYGVIDRPLFLDIYSFTVDRTWQELEGFAAIARRSAGDDSIFENFEFIAAISRQHLDAQRDLYPRDAPRRHPRLPAAAEALLVKER